MYRIFDRFFREKLGPIEQHNRKFFLKNAIKHQLLGSHRTTHSAKILGDPPRISLSSIFLYNSELWAPTKRMIEKTNCLRRSFLRKIINKMWSDKVSNKPLYTMTDTIPWSNVIRERWIRFLGHILRQQEYTPPQKNVIRNDETN